MKSSKLTTNFTITDQLCIKLPQGPPLGGRLGGEVIKKNKLLFYNEFCCLGFSRSGPTFHELIIDLCLKTNLGTKFW